MSAAWDGLGRDEATRRFDEYVAGHPAALQRFDEAYTSRRGKRKDLTFRPDSLVTVFRWAMKRFRLPPSPLPAGELDSPSAATVYWAGFDPVEYCRLGHELAAVADGIGSYVAETILRADDRAGWWLEPDPKNGGYNQPAVRVGDGLWLPVQAAALCSKGWRKLDLGYGNRADDPDRLADHVATVLANAGPSTGSGSAAGPDADDDFSTDYVAPSLHLAFSDEVAYERSEAIDRFVAEAADLPSIDRVRREDRELVIADVHDGAMPDAVIAELQALWSGAG